jgi:hypothetical protein
VNRLFFNDFHRASYREKTELNTQMSGWDCCERDEGHETSSTHRGKARPRMRGQPAIFLDDARFAQLATSRWLVVVPA